MSDLVVTVRQISNYPPKPQSDGTENVLVQDGIGAPYNSMTTSALVSSALFGGPALGVGMVPPSNAEGGVFTGTITTPTDGAIAWNAYLNQGDWRLLTPGQAASIGWDQTSGLDFAVSTGGSTGDQITWVPMMRLDNAGNLGLPYGTIGVARDPSASNEVVTLNYLANNTVQSFNNRKGAVQLNAQDVYNALKLCDPIATQPWVQQAINQSIQNLLYTCPFVNTWNGRRGSVYLMLSDISCVFMQPGQQPVTQTPPASSNDDSIPNTRWVTDLVAQFDAAANLSVINVLNYGARGDGVTDDSNAIQTALNNYAGKAIILIPDTGRSYMVSTLNLPSGLRLIIDGTLKRIVGTYSGTGLLNMVSVSHIRIEGNGVIDGNAPANTNGAGISTAVGCSNILIAGITVQNAGFWNVNLTQVDHAVLDGVTLIGGGAANEFNSASDCWLTNSLIDGTGLGDYAFCFYGGVHDSGAVGNTVKNAGAGTASGAPGIGVMSDSAQPASCSNIVVANNVVHDCEGSGLVCIAGPPGAIQSGIIFANNRCYNNCKNGVPSALVADCFVNITNGITISGNQFGSNLASYGVFLDSTTNYANVVGNQIYNMSGGSEPLGIFINGASNLLVNGNYIYDSQTTPTMAYSIAGNAGAKCIFTDNFLDRGFAVTAASDTVAMNYAAGGRSVQSGRMSLGAAPVAYTNASSIPRWYVGNQGNPETGGNSGSDFEIVSVNDAGTSLIGVPVVISRATGNLTLSGQLLPHLVAAANDAAAAAGGVPVGALYQNAGTVQVRLT